LVDYCDFNLNQLETTKKCSCCIELLNKTVLSIGFDDTDSPKGMCTTYLAYKIVDSLKKEKVEFLDFPSLIRFNPNIPWKTRGNGAVGLKIKTSKPQKIKKLIAKMISKFSDIQGGANPGLVFYEHEKIPQEFTAFSELALWQLIQRKHAKKFASSYGIESFYMGNGQGLVGAIGAIGYNFDDHTLELLSYRKKSKFGKQRKISSQSVKFMQDNTFPYTFNSYDDKKQKILIAPHGPDPVFYGIRGVNTNSLIQASKLIQTDEKLDGYMIFKSNQGTSDHLKNDIDVFNLRPYSSGKITGKIFKEPIMIKGGHVLFSLIKNEIEVNCAVYRPTGMTSIAMNLIRGDKICVGGGVRKASKNYKRIINVEFLKIMNLEKKFHTSNPLCTTCNKKMKSKGKNQGFQCVKCGKKTHLKHVKQTLRKIKPQLYIPITSAHRHLTRPINRMGVSNKKSEFDNTVQWFSTLKNE